VKRPLVATPVTVAGLRECPGCGLFQNVPALVPGTVGVCTRCGTTLRRARVDPIGRSIALTFAALILLVLLCSTTLMTVETAGISLTANLFSGPDELVARSMSALAVAVVFTTVLAPFGKLVAALYVLIGLRRANPPDHLRDVFVWVERLRPWSMIEVFVFGVLVAYVKLGDLVHIGLDTGFYVLMTLTFVMIWADASLDHESVWEALDRRGRAIGMPPRVLAPGGAGARAVGCHVCELVSVVDEQHNRCPRCEAVLHRRKPDSLNRTWALVIAAAVMYVPANYYPVLTVMQLGAGAPSTIFGGVVELVQSHMYPLAALVFFASIAVPMLKLVGLTVMLIATQTRRRAWLRDRTRLYHFVRWIGRWSMIDIFMESLLGALVRFGSVITIEPGMGAVAFCSVVVLTMFAAETFDPRLMWDVAEDEAQSPSASVAPAG
jgi:paraquat-inducible protein A